MKKLSVFLFGVLLSIAAVAGDGKTYTKKDIVGIWELLSRSVEMNGQKMPVPDPKKDETVEFREDGTTLGSDGVEGAYEVSGKTLTLKDGPSGMSLPFEITAFEDGKMVLKANRDGALITMEVKKK